ncbi:MAG: SRPBCC family protein [Actinobacteria bacterium]|nr:SRPBCC family protein [Actinomycetota bacterium]
MASYNLSTVFEIRTSAERVWAALTEPATWATTWPEVREVARVHRPLADGTDALHRFRFDLVRFPLGFEAHTVRARTPEVVEWSVRGDLEGRAIWELDDLDGVTFGKVTWHVRTTKALLNLAGPAIRRLAEAEHDRTMRHGIDALAAHLGTSARRVRTLRRGAVSPRPASATR